MREVIEQIDRWRSEGERVALATVIETWGSAPRRVGAKMALTPAGHIAGSVSGGCVEGAVFEAGTETIDSGHPQLLHFGVADETAWDVGLACGGQIEVFVEALGDELYEATRQLLEEEKPGAIVTVIDGRKENIGRKLVVAEGGVVIGALPDPIANEAVPTAQSVLRDGKARRITVSGDELFIEPLQPAPTLLMVGGVHIAIALASIAQTMGYRTIVVDPRRAFGSEERFSHVDRLIQKWPDAAFAELPLTSSTAVAMLTHDPKIDDPALKAVLKSQAFYIGALGSTSTHERRKKRLREAGIPEAQIRRIHGPIGLDIAAQTPEEIAVAIMAEIISERRKGER